jgi:SAM-dependent methyltransferase
VVGVDAAYHFDTRAMFLREAYARLQPGGRLVLTDLVRGRGSVSAVGAVVMARAFRVPPANWVDAATYVDLLASVGFVDIAMEVLTPRVLPGLARFLERQADAWCVATGALPWAPFLATAAGLWSVYRHGTLDVVLVSARRPAQ